MIFFSLLDLQSPYGLFKDATCSDGIQSMAAASIGCGRQRYLYIPKNKFKTAPLGVITNCLHDTFGAETCQRTISRRQRNTGSISAN